MTRNPVGNEGAWSPVRVLVVVLMFVASLVPLALLGLPAPMIVLAGTVTIVNLVALLLRRRSHRPGAVGGLTGRTLAAPVPSPAATPATPAPAAASPTPASPQTKWVGGASLATARGWRVNATAPLAVLTLTPGSLELSLRPKRLNQLWRISPLVLRPSDDIEAFPVRARGWTRGVGIRGHGVEVSYFWTQEREAVLQGLASAGFRVSWDERRYAP